MNKPGQVIRACDLEIGDCFVFPNNGVLYKRVQSTKMLQDGSTDCLRTGVSFSQEAFFKTDLDTQVLVVDNPWTFMGFI